MQVSSLSFTNQMLNLCIANYFDVINYFHMDLEYSIFNIWQRTSMLTLSVIRENRERRIGIDRVKDAVEKCLMQVFDH